MFICVCVKQTPDSASVYIDPISGKLDVERFVQVLNPADACAAEAAVRLKEQLGASVQVITLGPLDAEGALRAALALGADSVVRLWHPQAVEWGPATVASALAGYLSNGSMLPDLVICGDSASDWSSGIVGPTLAERLDLPQITGVSQIAATTDGDRVTFQVTRKLERGYRELLEAQPPLLITVTSDLNEPRYPSLPAHLAALKATIPVIDPLPLIGNADEAESDETTLLEIHTPRPRTRRIAAPNSHHSAFERIGEIIAGGAAGRKTTLVEGAPHEPAVSLLDYFTDRGFL